MLMQIIHSQVSISKFKLTNYVLRLEIIDRGNGE